MTYPTQGQPHPPQPSGPQHPHPQQPPQRKRPVWPWILIGAMVLLCGGCFGLVGLADTASEDTTTATFAPTPGAAEPAAVAPPPAAPDAAPVGATVRDGKFEFRVTAVDAPVRTLGSNPYLRSTAQGEYIQVHLVVTNIGERAQTYFGSNQHLIDDQGRRYDNDTEAEINVNDEIVTEINPGNSVEVIVVFDVPVGTVPAVLQLHDSAFSGGAKVALR